MARHEPDQVGTLDCAVSHSCTDNVVGENVMSQLFFTFDGSKFSANQRKKNQFSSKKEKNGCDLVANNEALKQNTRGHCGNLTQAEETPTSFSLVLLYRIPLKLFIYNSL